MNEDKFYRCRKKPVVVEYREVLDGETRVITEEGVMMCHSETDYIIRGVRGELYPIKKDIFAETYDIVGEEGFEG